jgi:isoleucyl-tRNA synthetase
MPVAQWGYPFHNKEMFESQFPADYISEAIDQTRGWFYSLHAISTLLFKSVAYKNVICLGHILDENGRKASKSLGNVVDPGSVIEPYGADAIRWDKYTASARRLPRRSIW